MTINSSVNFIIYVTFGEKFKRIFLLLFCKRRTRDSPEMLPDDSSFSNGDASNRNSGRFQRTNTTRCSSTRNGTSIKVQRTSRIQRAPSPGPIVYYPRETLPRLSNISLTRSTSLMQGDWREDLDLNGTTIISSAF